jgi:hypothetical protein
MIIRFIKARNQGKPDMLRCVLDDGSSTWWPLSPHFAQHDMLHYVVETTLGLEKAFFGLIAEGRDIDSFGTRDGRKDTYTRDEGEAELIVGLLQVEMRSNKAPGNTDFFEMLTLTCKSKGWPMPLHISAEQLDSIRAKMRGLSEKWRSLPAGGSIELVFSIQQTNRH